MEKETVKTVIFVFVVILAVVFMTLFFMKPLMEKNKVKDDLQQIFKQATSTVTDDQAKCMVDKASDGSNAQQLAAEAGILCAGLEAAVMSQNSGTGTNSAMVFTVPDKCKDYLNTNLKNVKSWGKDCNLGGQSSMLLSTLGPTSS